MSHTKGYYSIIQYCHDELVGEVASVGVVLLCPEQLFCKAMTERSNAKVIKYFGVGGDDLDRINFFKKSIEHRIECESSMRTREDLAKFVATRGNSIRMTAVRSVLVEDPQQTLEWLFSKVVGDVSQRRPKSGLKSVVGKKILAGNEEKIIKDIRVVVPVFEKEMEFPFAYQNGRLNLINVARFASDNVGSSTNTACRYAVEGKSLFETRHPKFGDMELNLVCQFKPGDHSTPRVVSRVLQEHHVKMFRFDQIGTLAATIRREGKQVPPAFHESEGSVT